ncbi:MAG: family 43 glycosylhydrolase [Oscillospiraceae bacterium]|jgi:arabinan endo-1,5-alpha-L-arabinosidase|nr:family 43 glycosylhydrolase [Oscillospiraceae bacterium]
MAGPGEGGALYDAAADPNVIDPNTFYDKEGRLWMVYGSYSGGVRMDEATGLPQPGQGYGKKLLDKNHARIEGPYILYAPETDYYYLFLSFGGLEAGDGYNIRVCRSRRPDGPYLDALEQDMIRCGGPEGSFFGDRAIEPYGVKLLGGFRFMPLQGVEPLPQQAYKSSWAQQRVFRCGNGRLLSRLPHPFFRPGRYVLESGSPVLV